MMMHGGDKMLLVARAGETEKLYHERCWGQFDVEDDLDLNCYEKDSNLRVCCND